MADEEESGGFIVGSGGGRGRGRGGGVPVLPAGIWSALNSSEGAPGLQSEDPSFGDDAMPMGFGRGRGSAAGRGAGRGSDAGRGRGFVRDAKGTDWDCPSCGNVNWHWRSTCNKCNGAKPAHILTAEEVRDGVGGGFNERQDRVSTTSVEVAEDGFDDFGRRKKKAAADRSAKEAAALARLQQSYGYLLHQPAAAEADSDKLKPSSAASTAGGRKSSYGFSASAQFADAEDDGPKTIRPSFGSSNATANGGNGATSGSSNKPGQSSGKSQNDRDRDRDRDADREREKDRDRSNRDKDTSNTRDRDRERSRDRDRVRDRSRDRDRDRSRDRDRDRDRSGRESGRGGESARDSGRDDRYPAYRGDKDRDHERDNRDRDRYRDHR